MTTVLILVVSLVILNCSVIDTLDDDKISLREKRQMLYPSLIGTMFGPVYQPMYVRKSLVRRTPWGPQILNPNMPIYPW